MQKAFQQASILIAFVVAMANAHSILISPRPRNAIDTLDPRWGQNGSSPDVWQPQYGNVGGAACACRNGTEAACLSGQTCLWMSVGCTIGCKECDGGIINNKSVGTNPNTMDRCGSGMKARPCLGIACGRVWARACVCLRTKECVYTCMPGSTPTQRNPIPHHPWHAGHHQQPAPPNLQPRLHGLMHWFC
jgi:hypothetical protein